MRVRMLSIDTITTQLYTYVICTIFNKLPYCDYTKL
jgi:hypothetical protein